MQKIDELNKEISDSKKRQKQLLQEYSSKLSEIAKSLKKDYFSKISDEENVQKYLNSEIYSFLCMIRSVDNFNCDDLGNALAKLLTQTTNQEYSYACLETYMYEYSTISNGFASIVFPKSKIKIDEKKHSRMTLGEITRDESIIILKPFVNLKTNNQVSFYNYSLMSKDNPHLTSNYAIDCFRFPQIKEFIDYVLETHAIDEWEKSHFHTQINEKELNLKLAEYLASYYLKKASNFDDYSKTLGQIK